MDKAIQRSDVIIVGAGVVGATLALALGRSGLRIVVCDTTPPPVFDSVEYDLRVSALGRAAERVFDNLGVWVDIVRHRVSPFRKMHVWDSGSSGAIRFDAAEVGEPQLGHIIENSLVVFALHRQLRKHQNITMIYEAEVDRLLTARDEVSLTIGRLGEQRASLLVAADGSSSWVRKQLGIAVNSLEYDQRAIVAQVTTEQPHQQTAWQRFLATGPLAFLPLADGSCSIVWSCKQALAEQLLAMDGLAFQEALGQAFEHRLGNITNVGPRQAFALRDSHVQDYIGQRTALIGDAAHTVHPLAGQGANLGIADAATLADVVLDAATSHRDIGSRAVLRRYERWRKAENALMANAIYGLHRLFSAQAKSLRQLRGLGLRLTDMAGPVKRVIVRRAMGLTGDLPRLARNVPAPR